MSAGVYSALVLAFTCAAASLQGGTRSVPQPATGHPGNIFTTREDVVIRAPAGDAPSCQVIDYEGKVVSEVQCADGSVSLGRPGAGTPGRSVRRGYHAA